MNTRRSFVIVTLAAGIAASALSFVLWPSPSGGPPLTPLQLALFLIIYIGEAFLFGFGVAFAAFGLPAMRDATRLAGVRTWPAFVAITWSLVAWWPHDGFHRAAPAGDVNAVLRIEYAFHATLIVAGILCAQFFLATLRATIAPRSHESSRRMATVRAAFTDR
jgi:hypothetical protein